MSIRSSTRSTLYGLVMLLLAAVPLRAADAVTEWTLEADRLGDGGANWHTLAIMQMAMHDAINAVHPVYARWAEKRADEPPGAGASPDAALAGAAAQVLVDLHPERRDEIAAVFQAALRPLGHTASVTAGLALGEAIGKAAIERRAHDGYRKIHAFRADDRPGRWRPVPPDYQGSNTTATRPFLFSKTSDFAATSPPSLGSDHSVRDVMEARRLGALHTPDRTAAQSEAARFWAYQSSQRGFMLLAVKLLDADPRPGRLAVHARIMSQLATAMADSAIMVWAEKERFAFWRPITAIRCGGFGVEADPTWLPFIDTPAFPEYPSGHAADCYTGAGVLESLFSRRTGAIDYVAQSGLPHDDTANIGMGQHAQPGGLVEVSRHFPSLQAAARECALSRIWAGAHFWSADEEAVRLATTIVVRAQAAVPPLRR